ncbi:hypothetical protein HPB52_009952 [Rhipicephalus sanguineus]|uniref:Secreted protein n=1 Tax=Rhipicephalus sanguineus TaxID=34632 RepID=A0A9D4SVZ5_RHISA|nr:hypothetical protein HPB52_009952 [Rhipicephalus sanguineus]
MLVLGCSSLIFLFFIIVRHCWRCPGGTPGDLAVESIAGFLRIVDGTSTGSGISESAASLGLPGRPFSLGGSKDVARMTSVGRLSEEPEATAVENTGPPVLTAAVENPQFEGAKL